MKKMILFKTMAYCFMTLVAMGMLTACSSSDDSQNSDEPQPTPTPTPTPDVFHPIDASTRTLLEVTGQNEYNPTEFGEVIGSWPMLNFMGDRLGQLLKNAMINAANSRLPQMDEIFKERVGTAPDGTRQWNLKRYTFTYKSISGVTGNDTTLVGSVIFPNNTVGTPHQVDVLTLYHHQAYFFEEWLPSHAVTMMALHALHNSAVIEPDAQGAKRGVENHIRENLQGDLTALQMADCVLAALEVMRQESVTLAADGYSNNWGTSLGSVAATGFAQYMENDATPDLQQLFRLRATYIGEGPTMLNQVRGYEDAVSNPPVQKFYDGWNPQLPFYMSSCPDDELIDYNELKKYFGNLRTMPDGSVNVKVQWFDFNLPPLIKAIMTNDNVKERLDGLPVHLIASVVTLYAACMVENPADVGNFLTANNLLGEQ